MNNSKQQRHTTQLTGEEGEQDASDINRFLKESESKTDDEIYLSFRESELSP